MPLYYIPEYTGPVSCGAVRYVSSVPYCGTARRRACRDCVLASHVTSRVSSPRARDERDELRRAPHF